jgi:hypothetical protein
MYSCFKKGTEIHLWCEGTIEPDDPEPAKKQYELVEYTPRACILK